MKKKDYKKSIKKIQIKNMKIYKKKVFNSVICMSRSPVLLSHFSTQKLVSKNFVTF